MSTVVPVEVDCPACGEKVLAIVADSVSANRSPWLRDGLLAGTFHGAACSKCGARFAVEKELLYLDFDRGQFVGVFPPADRPRFFACGELVTRTFGEAMFERAPPFVAGWAAGFRVRVVFGLAELREKVLCWEHGLDDGVLELLKIDLLADRPQLLAEGICGLRLDAVFGSGALGFVTLRLEEADAAEVHRGVSVPRSIYDQVAAAAPSLRPAHAALLDGPWVNLLRYLLPPPPTDEDAPRATPDRGIWRDSRP